MSGTSQATPHVAGAVALCFGRTVNGVPTPGPCAGLTTPQVIQKFTADAAFAAANKRGFKDDKATSALGKHYGNLIDAGAF